MGQPNIWQQSMDLKVVNPVHLAATTAAIKLIAMHATLVRLSLIIFAVLPTNTFQLLEELVVAFRAQLAAPLVVALIIAKLVIWHG